MTTIKDIKKLFKSRYKDDYDDEYLSQLLDHEKLIYFNDTLNIKIIIATNNTKSVGIIVLPTDNIFGWFLEYIEYFGDIEKILKEIHDYIEDQIIKYNNFISSGKYFKDYLLNNGDVRGWIVDNNILKIKIPKLDELNL
jgi:hypothetical protein